jgi:hypothetical protein
MVAVRRNLNPVVLRHLQDHLLAFKGNFLPVNINAGHRKPQERQTAPQNRPAKQSP